MKVVVKLVNGEAKIATDELEQEDFDIDLITSGEKQKSASVDDQAPPKKRQRVEWCILYVLLWMTCQAMWICVNVEMYM